MRFSIIIPAHNEEERIGRALTSVLGQQFQDFETIVVCDSCTDDTAQVCEQYGLRPEKISAGSPGGAKNVGIERARGQYLLFLDADDYFLTPDSVQRVDEGLRNQGDPDILHFSFFWGRTLAPPISWHDRHYGIACSRAWKRTLVGPTRFPSSSFAEDYRFCVEMFSKGGSHGMIDDPIFQYVYPREGSLSHVWRFRSPTERASLQLTEDEEWRTGIAAQHR